MLLSSIEGLARHFAMENLPVPLGLDDDQQ